MKQVKKIKNIILDLDMTLICSLEINNKSFINPRLDHKVMKNYFNIYGRPHLQEFLSYIFLNFNVSIWTAASKDYAMFVINKFILENHPERHLKYIFFSYHCDESSLKTGNSKQINFLKKYCNIHDFSSNNTLIIDDNTDVRDCQPEMCYLIKQFDCKNPLSYQDTELIILENYLKSMS